jgi:hypothetical protein
MSIEDSLDRLAANVAMIAGAISTLAEAVNGTYKGKPIYTQVVAEAPSQETAPSAPKATRQKKAAVAAVGMDSPASAAAGAAAPAKEPEKAADDLFGEEEKPTETQEIKKAKALTQDDVRAALVAAQTALKSKDLAVDILAKHTTGNARVLSKLPESAFAALIKECNDAVAKAPK